MLRVLTLSTLFPNAVQPNLGVFVERQTLGLAAHPDVDLRVVSPVGIPPGPLARLPRYARFCALPVAEDWRGLAVQRPRFLNWPGMGGRRHAAEMVRALTPVLTAIRRDFAFDVIDAEFFFPDGPAAVALGAQFGVPVSIKARGSDIHHWGAGPTAGQVLRAAHAADGLLAVSAALRDDMVALGMPGDRITVHYTGVDLNRFVPVDRVAAKQALGIAGPMIVSLGALIERKGHGVVIDAIAAIPGATLLIVGEGPHRSALKVQIDRLGLAHRVRLTGAVAHADMPALLAAADVMALASETEGLANAWVEALACGVPIVITGAGGAQEVVTHPDYGRIVAPTANAFADAISALLSAPQAQDAVRRGALRFTWPVNTIALYDHLTALVGR